MAKQNYSYEKRQRELAKKKKLEEKTQRKLAAKNQPVAGEETPEVVEQDGNDSPAS